MNPHNAGHEASETNIGTPAASEWWPTERERREQRMAMAPVLHRAAWRANERRFTGDPITSWGAL